MRILSGRTAAASRAERDSASSANPGIDTPDSTQRPTVKASADDAELIARIRLGDVASFEQVFHRYYDVLCAFVFGYVRSRAVAEDVVQDLFIRIWQRRAEWQLRESIRSYLYGCARNGALRVVKHDQVVARYETRELQDLERQPPVAASPHDETVARELEAAVANAVAALSEQRREIYTLRWQHHLTIAEIASHLHMTPKAVELKLARASKQVRAALAPLVDRKQP